jgi:polyphosphate kinase
MFPIEEARLLNRIVEGILSVALSDNVKARVLGPDGVYRRIPGPKPGDPVIRSQVEFQNMARELSSKNAMRPVPPVAGPTGVPR